MAEVVDVPPHPLQISIYGRKGEGKTELAWMYWDSWEGDRVLIDPNGDCLKNHPDDECLELTDDMAGAGWGALDAHRSDGGRLSLRYVPSGAMDDKSYREALDRVVGFAYAHPDVLLWCDEFSEVARIHQVQPHTRRMLRMSRHVPMTIVTTDIRPKNVDPLGLAQADVVVMYDIPNADDRKRLADAIGWDPADLDAEIKALGPHCYLRYVASAKELSSWPPIPLKGPGRSRIAEDDLMGDPDGRQ